ncbi:16S rRNA (cytosine(1402)-N(4))-methyltransferase RsmH [Zavarzinia sp. CC-PAN008]|uniref:16S rRNA (cytosine(1402)-N(4))-methyltransferase RsmH n=1 Tax=Zavarzinia sp. CC-PAN008 TaxID=3243332 RepID=UPI003F74207C
MTARPRRPAGRTDLAVGAHVPVLLDEVIAALEPGPERLYVDGTFGAGGYSRAILAAQAQVIGIDQDPAAIAAGQAMVAEHGGRLTLIEGRFGDMERLLAERGLGPVDGVALDLGVSSRQLDDGARGFSFRMDAALDMRMGTGSRTAADLVNDLEEGALADLIYRLGEEPASRRIARAIVRARPIGRTLELADLVARAVGGPPGSRTHPATRTFQALRMAVNEELEQLDAGLDAAERVLKPGGRLAVVAFHSLEDRVVKQFLATRSGDQPRPSRYLPDAPANDPGRPPTFRLMRRGAQKPGERELASNPRARSARLRAAERTTVPLPQGTPR